MISVFGCTCPLSGTCSKGGSFFKGASRDEALSRLKTHLVKSSYHLLEDVDADLQLAIAEVGAPKRLLAHVFRRTSVALGSPRSERLRGSTNGASDRGARLKVEEWTEDTDEWERWQKANDEQWCKNNRRRGARSAPYQPPEQVAPLSQSAVAAAFPKGSGKGGPLQLNMSGASSPVSANIAPEATVQLNSAQAQVILDSVTRARMCSAACLAVAERSAVAFRAEQAALADLQETLASWLSNNAS